MAGFINKNVVAAKTNHALNRRGVYTSANLDNGSVMNLLTYSSETDESNVWVATAPATGALSDLWMAATDGVVSITSGTKTYRGLSNDFVNDFTNVAGEVIDFFRLQVGDIIELTADAIGGTKSTNTFIVATDGEVKLQWGAAAVAGLSLELKGESYVSYGSGAIASQRKTTYRFEVVAVA